MSVDPPVSDGADHESEIAPFVGVATTLVGDAAFALGVTDALACAGAPVPAAFSALTRKRYAVPFVRPVTVKSRAEVVAAVVQVAPSTDVSMRYEVTTAPPLAAGAVHVNVTNPSPAAVVTVVGALGVVAGVAKTGSVAAPAPAAFVARIRNA